MNYYYVGQKVSHQDYGDGIVTKIDLTSVCPVVISFNNNELRSFTLDGKYTSTSLFPSLSQNPHVPLELKEIITFEKGELVWVKSRVNTWVVRYYSHLDGIYHMIFNNQKKEGYTSAVTEVRKFNDCPLELFEHIKE